MKKFREKLTLLPISKDLIEKYKSHDNLLRHLDPNDEGYFLFSSDMDLIGYIAWDDNTITSLEIMKEFRDQSYSSFLLKKAVENGCNRLTVNKNNQRAINIYEHLGWTRTGTLGPKMLVYELN